MILADQSLSLSCGPLNTERTTVKAHRNTTSPRISTVEPTAKLAHRRFRSSREVSSSPNWGIDCGVGAARLRPAVSNQLACGSCKPAPACFRSNLPFHDGGGHTRREQAALGYQQHPARDVPKQSRGCSKTQAQPNIGEKPSGQFSATGLHTSLAWKS